MKILKELEIQRGEEVIQVDLTEEDAYTAIEQTWGVASWKIVDGFSTPFLLNDLRDGTRFCAQSWRSAPKPTSHEELLGFHSEQGVR
jgi:hypothetical protein